jgi:hypothetical protein
MEAQAKVVAAEPAVVVRHVTVEANFGAVPVITTCPSCKLEIKTHVQLSCGAYATCCVFLLLINFCIPCAIAPCVMDSFQDKTHTCPNCQFILSKKGGNIIG